MPKLMKLFFVVLMVMLVVPGFAFNGSNLSRAMDSAAQAGEYLNHLMHPGMPKPWTNPMYLTTTEKLSEAWRNIDKEISSVETAKDIENARAVVELYKSLKGTYRDLGHQVEISLQKRIKFLEVHGA